MSTQMKDILTTLELLTKEKIDPETILEEGEIEQTLKLDEDGELLPGQQLDEAFTKQHFELFADMLKSISDNDTRDDYASRLVAMFEKDNPRFNKEMFLQAAGIDTADEKTELVYDEHGSVHQIRPSEVDAFLQGHPGRGLAESV